MKKLIAVLAFAAGVSTAAFAQYAPAPTVSSLAQAAPAAAADTLLLKVQQRG